MRALLCCTNQSGRRGSNPRHQAWKACALPAELLPQTRPFSAIRSSRHASINLSNFLRIPLRNGGGRIRTFEGVSRQIYSLLPLATWVPHLINFHVKRRSSHSSPVAFPTQAGSCSQRLPEQTKLVRTAKLAERIGKVLREPRKVGGFKGLVNGRIRPTQRPRLGPRAVQKRARCQD